MAPPINVNKLFAASNLKESLKVFFSRKLTGRIECMKKKIILVGRMHRESSSIDTCLLFFMQRLCVVAHYLFNTHYLFNPVHTNVPVSRDA